MGWKGVLWGVLEAFYLLVLLVFIEIIWRCFLVGAGCMVLLGGEVLEVFRAGGFGLF